MPLSHLTGLPRSRPPVHVELEPPVGSDEHRAVLEAELTRVQVAGDDVCDLLRMTREWGAATWVAGTHAGELVATYRNVVTGDVTSPSVVRSIVVALTRHAWRGTLASPPPTLRVDAEREHDRLTLMAESGRVTVTLTGPTVRTDVSLASWILAGVFDDE